MRIVLLLLASLLLAGCATPKVAQPADFLFQDALFKPLQVALQPAEVFTASAEMKRYLEEDVRPNIDRMGPARGLYQALYNKNLLKIEYDAAMTRNAAQTFAARSGNCLSLAIMTAALAKDLGLQVRYQVVEAEEMWSRASGIYFSSRHVNVTLGRKNPDPRQHFGEQDLLTIDFSQVGELQQQRASVIEENTVMAMYMNNRAAEILAEGDSNDAYWLAREAARLDPGYMSALNTLAVVYRRVGHLPGAEAVLRHVLTREPDNTHALANLALTYRDLGRPEEAQALSAKLARLQPEPPFFFYERGVAALKRGEFKMARELLQREVDRDSTYHEFQFALAAAYVGLGEYGIAAKHLRVALQNSPGKERELYAAKLARLTATRAN